MTNDTTKKASTRRRYSPEEKAQAVRLVLQLREELGTSQGTVGRIATQLEGRPRRDTRSTSSRSLIDELQQVDLGG